MHSVGLFNALYAGLILWASLQQCSASPATPTSTSTSASVAIPPVVPPDSSSDIDDSWASRTVYNLNGTDTNAISKRSSPRQFSVKFAKKEDKSYYYIYTGDGANREYVAAIELDGPRLGAGGYGNVTQGYLHRFDSQEDECSETWTKVAVKFSLGPAEYDSAVLFSEVDSPNIVTPLQYGYGKVLNPFTNRQEIMSVVALELLDTTAHKAWRSEQFDEKKFITDVTDGLQAAADKKLWIGDLKFDNIMSKTAAIGADAQWKIIDLGLTVSGDPKAIIPGFAGSFGFMAPGKKMGKSWILQCTDIGKLQRWRTTGYMGMIQTGRQPSNRNRHSSSILRSCFSTSRMENTKGR